MLKYLSLICLFTTAALAECPSKKTIEELAIGAIKGKIEGEYIDFNVEVGLALTKKKHDESCVYSAGGQEVIILSPSVDKKK